MVSAPDTRNYYKRNNMDILKVDYYRTWDTSSWF